jgi:signal transduction histidine kinase/ABC-type branched-subunit amino acid transport system ATPase component
MEYHSNNNQAVSNLLLRLEDIKYKFDNVQVLKDINLDVRCSEFHAIVGDHGSGKSSLAMIISGMLRPTSGIIHFNDKTYKYLTLKKARKLDIQMACQDVHLINYFTVAENLFMPDKVYPLFPIKKKNQLIQDAEELLARYGFDIDPVAIINNLPISDRMVIHILRSINRPPKLLVLDAVLGKLTPAHLARMFELLQKIKKSGATILCVTHTIDDIYSLADKVTIIRNGQVILTDSIDNIDKINLIKLCYTQIAKGGNAENYHEFYQLLRYNEAILQKLPINLIVTDNENNIKMINDHGREYFKLNDLELNALSIDDLFKSHNNTALRLLKAAFCEKKEKTFYTVPVTIDDSNNITNIRILPIYDGPFLIGNITIIEDISGQEELRQQVILSEKLASVGILAAGVAHEINNPLEIIYNHLNFIKYTTDKDKLNESIANIEEEINDIKQIVSNLISFSDSKKLVVEEFDLNALISSILNLIRFSARKKHIKIDFKPSRQTIYLSANANEIKQVILNLLKNSFEAYDGIGKIDISTFIKGDLSNRTACIVFRDYGCGIEDVNPDNIFLPFYSKKNSDTNLGMGLSVSYGILRKYHGKISVRNSPNAGCEFTITLPMVS